jgi:hypothetical protein
MAMAVALIPGGAASVVKCFVADDGAKDYLI